MTRRLTKWTVLPVLISFLMTQVLLPAYAENVEMALDTSTLMATITPEEFANQTDATDHDSEMHASEANSLAESNPLSEPTEETSDPKPATDSKTNVAEVYKAYEVKTPRVKNVAAVVQVKTPTKVFELSYNSNYPNAIANTCLAPDSNCNYNDAEFAYNRLEKTGVLVLNYVNGGVNSQVQVQEFKEVRIIPTSKTIRVGEVQIGTFVRKNQLSYLIVGKPVVDVNAPAPVEYPSTIEINGMRVQVEMAGLVRTIMDMKDKAREMTAMICIEGCDTAVDLYLLQGIKDVFSLEELSKFESFAHPLIGGAPNLYTKKGWIDFTTELLRRYGAKGLDIYSIPPIHYEDGKFYPDILIVPMIGNDKVLRFVQHGIHETPERPAPVVVLRSENLNSVYNPYEFGIVDAPHVRRLYLMADGQMGEKGVLRINREVQTDGTMLERMELMDAATEIPEEFDGIHYYVRLEIAAYLLPVTQDSDATMAGTGAVSDNMDRPIPYLEPKVMRLFDSQYGETIRLNQNDIMLVDLYEGGYTPIEYSGQWSVQGNAEVKTMTSEMEQRVLAYLKEEEGKQAASRALGEALNMSPDQVAVISSRSTKILNSDWKNNHAIAEVYRVGMDIRRLMELREMEQNGVQVNLSGESEVVQQLMKLDSSALNQVMFFGRARFEADVSVMSNGEIQVRFTPEALELIKQLMNPEESPEMRAMKVLVGQDLVNTFGLTQEMLERGLKEGMIQIKADPSSMDVKVVLGEYLMKVLHGKPDSVRVLPDPLGIETKLPREIMYHLGLGPQMAAACMISSDGIVSCPPPVYQLESARYLSGDYSYELNYLARESGVIQTQFGSNRLMRVDVYNEKPDFVCITTPCHERVRSIRYNYSDSVRREINAHIEYYTKAQGPVMARDLTMQTFDDKLLHVVKMVDYDSAGEMLVSHEWGYEDYRLAKITRSNPDGEVTSILKGLSPVLYALATNSFAENTPAAYSMSIERADGETLRVTFSTFEELFAAAYQFEGAVNLAGLK